MGTEVYQHGDMTTYEPLWAGAVTQEWAREQSCRGVLMDDPRGGGIPQLPTGMSLVGTGEDGGDEQALGYGMGLFDRTPGGVRGIRFEGSEVHRGALGANMRVGGQNPGWEQVVRVPYR